jgi:membrane protein implicated in regulation of membrane protease activity
MSYGGNRLTGRQILLAIGIFVVLAFAVGVLTAFIVDLFKLPTWVQPVSSIVIALMLYQVVMRWIRSR